MFSIDTHRSSGIFRFPCLLYPTLNFILGRHFTNTLYFAIHDYSRSSKYTMFSNLHDVGYFYYICCDSDRFTFGYCCWIYLKVRYAWSSWKLGDGYRFRFFCARNLRTAAIFEHTFDSCSSCHILKWLHSAFVNILTIFFVDYQVHSKFSISTGNN